MFKNICIIAAKNNDLAYQKKDFLIKKYGFQDLTFDHKNITKLKILPHRFMELIVERLDF